MGRERERRESRERLGERNEKEEIEMDRNSLGERREREIRER